MLISTNNALTNCRSWFYGHHSLWSSWSQSRSCISYYNEILSINILIRAQRLHWVQSELRYICGERSILHAIWQLQKLFSVYILFWYHAKPPWCVIYATFRWRLASETVEFLADRVCEEPRCVACLSWSIQPDGWKLYDSVLVSVDASA